MRDYNRGGYWSKPTRHQTRIKILNHYFPRERTSFLTGIYSNRGGVEKTQLTLSYLEEA